MSNHHEWSERVILEAKLTKPFAPENSIPLKFNIGDAVIYTNDYGVQFRCKITGFYRRDDSLYAMGHRYYLNGSSPWMPVKEANLSHPIL